MLPRADAGALEVSGSGGRADRGRHSRGLTREAPANAAAGQHVRPGRLPVVSERRRRCLVGTTNRNRGLAPNAETDTVSHVGNRLLLFHTMPCYQIA